MEETLRFTLIAQFNNITNIITIFENKRRSLTLFVNCDVKLMQKYGRNNKCEHRAIVINV